MKEKTGFCPGQRPVSARLLEALFFYKQETSSLLYKNAPRGSHWGDKENAAFAARRRRRILRSRILS
ncbi:hypothetical protein CLS_35990 [[Clostridium] cf. saccharolyticum K10]|nr:hypothetical protein CLS_35990 [[Clostridium] cf. saccharolyticum K10]